MTTRIYKIATRAQWEEATECVTFRGAPVDLADGYIHFSTAEQVEETAARHFHGQKQLLLIAIEAEALGQALKWERSRGGALFPHLYGEFDPEQALSVLELQDCEDGGHKFPETY